MKGRRVHLRAFFSAASAIAAIAASLPSSSFAQDGPWLTLMGDPGNSNSELVEADADSIRYEGVKRTLYLRVNRASQRTAETVSSFAPTYHASKSIAPIGHRATSRNGFTSGPSGPARCTNTTMRFRTFAHSHSATCRALPAMSSCRQSAK